MEQLALFDILEPPKRLETYIERSENTLVIPEGISTIPCTHGIHRFAGKFIPNLPRYLLRTLMSDETGRVLLDPFCGSGTTLVEAALEGKQFIGVDIDPLSVAISTVKTQALSESELRQLERFWQSHDYRKEHPEVIPQVPNLSHWFSKTAIAELSSIKARCIELPPRLLLFSLVVFSSIIRRVSNADDQTQKTYVSHTLPKNPPLPSALFPIFLARAIEGMYEYIRLLPREPKGIVLQGDASADIESLQFDDVLTSPPYIDSIDYVYNQMLEYFWLLKELSINSYENYREMRKRPMGFRLHKESTIKDFGKELPPKLEERFEAVCHHIRKKSPKEELAVRSFFFDYAKHVRAIRSRQHKGHFYVCIVGNSFIRGITVPTVAFIEGIHTSMGYKLVDSMTYEIRRHYMKFPRRSNSGKINQDYILVFEVR